MTSIHLSPPEVAARIVPGHWEGDLSKGDRNASAVGTLVERSSRYVMLVNLDGFGSTPVLEGFTKRLRRVPGSLRKTLTNDQGAETPSTRPWPSDCTWIPRYGMEPSHADDMNSVPEGAWQTLWAGGSL
jgi:IS30 family transposase